MIVKITTIEQEKVYPNDFPIQVEFSGFKIALCAFLEDQKT